MNANAWSLNQLVRKKLSSLVIPSSVTLRSPLTIMNSKLIFSARLWRHQLFPIPTLLTPMTTLLIPLKTMLCLVVPSSALSLLFCSSLALALVDATSTTSRPLSWEPLQAALLLKRKMRMKTCCAVLFLTPDPTISMIQPSLILTLLLLLKMTTWNCEEDKSRQYEWRCVCICMYHLDYKRWNMSYSENYN